MIKNCKTCNAPFSTHNKKEVYCCNYCQIEDEARKLGAKIRRRPAFKEQYELYKQNGCVYCSEFSDECVMELNCKFTRDDFVKAKELNLNDMFFPKQKQPRIFQLKGIVKTGKKFKVY